MSLFTHRYSGLITKGLGLPACQGMLYMGFGVFNFTIRIGGGGGGVFVPPTTTGFYVPLPKQLNKLTQTVLITVKMREHSWRTSFIVTRGKADMIVKVINVINSSKDKINVGISSLKRYTRQITAVFKRSDK
jgi:hypothetical protein